MFDNSEANQQLMPTYPSTIKGELRIILQVKDQFLLCFKHLENLTSLWEQQNRIITKEFILEQIKSGDSEIEQLELELREEKEFTQMKETHNDSLIFELKSRGEYFIADSSKRRVKSCKSALFKSCQLDIQNILLSKDSAFIAILENIGERIDAAQSELKIKLRPLLEFYKDLFYLQLHFTLALTQISCFCMPLMTDSISLIDRLFFWTERPEFELIKRSGQICDRLRDIYTRLQRILNRLFDSVSFLQDRIELQRLLEIKFYEKMKQIGSVKDDILENIHAQRLHSDLLEEENDRLIGTLIKIDPFFINSDAFKLHGEQHSATNSKDSSDGKVSQTLLGKSVKINSDYKAIDKTLKVNPHQESDSIGTDYTTSSQTLNNINMSNVQTNITARLSRNHSRSTNLNHWKRQIVDIVSNIKNYRSNSESRADNFSAINQETGKDFVFSTPSCKRSGKYKIKFDDSDPNQTTDALVMTSEILPKDD